ncbi:MAG: hypothetical protein ACON35_06330 [Candidatus Marinamargulisbacteria bacterium]
MNGLNQSFNGLLLSNNSSGLRREYPPELLPRGQSLPQGRPTQNDGLRIRIPARQSLAQQDTVSLHNGRNASDITEQT